MRYDAAEPLNWNLIQFMGVKRMKLNFQVDENMHKAQKRNACQSELFWFRKDVRDKEACDCANGKDSDEKQNECKKMECEYELMTVDQIINGKVRSLDLQSFPS